MNTGKKYKTKQKELIMQCIRENADSYITIQQLFELLNQQDNSVGLTTIYRNLDKLEQEREITRVHIEGISGTCYRYMPKEENVLFYMKCEVCEKLVNIQCPELARLYTHISEDHNIDINPGKTMFYGTCEACRKQ